MNIDKTKMHKILRVLKRPFHKKDPESQSWLFFKELEDSLKLIEDIELIGNNFSGKIREFIPVKRLLLLIYDKDTAKFKVINSIGFEKTEVSRITFLSNDPLIKWLKVNKTHFYAKAQPGVFNYLTEKERNTLQTLGIDLCFPLISMNRLIGMIFIGPKESHEDFSKKELTLISSLMPQTGIALENAVLYKEQRERFRRMSRADKLATIGELAAGAAHEIRNPLTGIKSSLQYLKTKNQSEKEKKLLTTALQETERIDDILSALLSFSRPSDTKKEKSNILDIIDESLELITFQARKQKIKITRDYPPSPLFLNGDKAQLKQLFLNIFLNSLQSMKVEDELKIEVNSTDHQNILIAINDSGEGITEENLDKIFDPFFTTKKGGTGLGLTICYGIVKSHKGEIEIKSQTSQGTTALITFPLF